MGIDFGKLVNNLGITAAKMQNDKSKIDTTTELNTYVSGWEIIKKDAVERKEKYNENVNIEELESTMKSELASLMGASFGETVGVENKGTAEEPVFSDEDISLENLMSYLEPEQELVMENLREYNKKPILSSIGDNIDKMKTLNEFGFDPYMTNLIMDNNPGVLKYISDAIKSGRADAISNSVQDATSKIDHFEKSGIVDALIDTRKNVKE